MKTNYVIASNPAYLSRDPGNVAIVAAAQDTKYAKQSAARRKATTEANAKSEKNESRYTPDTQPRTTDGRFRRILARLKTNMGGEATEEIASKIEEAEVAQVAGDYDQMRENSNQLIGMIDSIQDGSMPKGVTKNLREGASDLGRVLAYLPLPQGNANAKIRFSDLPPASSVLVREMVKKVTEQLGQEDAEKYTKELNSFMTGSRTMSSDEMAVFLNKLLRVLA